MGLFGKKEACPACGGEVKGLFNKKISGKQKLCKDCSNKISMQEELLKAATPEYIKEHLAYRDKNLMKYNSLRWDVVYKARGFKMGVDPSAGFLYLRDELMDDYDNPVVFSFDQLIHYELYRMNKMVDNSDTPGETALDSRFSLLSDMSKIVSGKSSMDYFRVVLKTTEPYWPEVNIRINFNSPDDVYSSYGFGNDLTRMCQIFKQIIRKEATIIF